MYMGGNWVDEVAFPAIMSEVIVSWWTAHRYPSNDEKNQNISLKAQIPIIADKKKKTWRNDKGR